MTISIRAAAIELGISHTALRKRIGHGKISWPPESMDALRDEWEENKDVEQQRRGAHSTSIPRVERETRAERAEQQQAAAPKQKRSEAPSTLRPILPPGVPTLAVSSAREAALKVEKRALDMAQRKGMLLEAAKVNQFIGGMILKAAEVLDRLPDELADRLAQQSDPVACRDLLRREIGRARFELAEYRA